ncbi:MAG TPA: ATP-binding protein [Thermoanaerobaculia bacterium]|nr:ATP-binding protein [Thermoanaerobaculia bacterium]
MRLQARLTLFFAVLAAVGAALLIGVFGRAVRRVVDERATERLSLELEHLAGDLERVGDTREREELFRRAASVLACRITLVAPDGRVLHETGLLPADVARMENHASREEVREAFERGSGESRRYSTTTRREMLYRARRLADGSVLRLAVAGARLEEQESPYLWGGRVAILAASAFLFLIGAVGAARLTRPIDDLTREASAVAGGDYGRDLRATDTEPLAALGRSLQRMKDSLVAALGRAESERRLTAMVFERLPDGLVIVDERLHVVEANERFAKMTGVTAPVGRALYDLLRLRSLYDLFERTLKSGEVSQSTARLADDIVWEVLVLPLPPGSRAAAVGVLRDVTRLERTEAMRRTFVADVSHELRTPIASIGAAAETLAEGQVEEPEASELAGVILRQTARMRELIEDLMDLAEIESGAVALEMREVPLLPLAREVAHDLAAAAREKRIEVALAGDESVTAHGDRRRLAQVVRNLLDNAIKFSPPSATVEVRVPSDSRSPTLIVEDQGPGIPKGEREKIFQRFYQIDRSRSKTRPGSGLGLAIVKHLVHLHGGSIDVEGGPGQGSRFIVRLPP